MHTLRLRRHTHACIPSGCAGTHMHAYPQAAQAHTHAWFSPTSPPPSMSTPSGAHSPTLHTVRLSGLRTPQAHERACLPVCMLMGSQPYTGMGHEPHAHVMCALCRRTSVWATRHSCTQAHAHTGTHPPVLQGLAVAVALPRMQHHAARLAHDDVSGSRVPLARGRQPAC